MTEQRDPGQSEHEREVARHEENQGGGLPSNGASVDEGRRPTSGEDLAAERTGRDEDVVGDDMSPPGQNSDRLPQ